MKYLFLILETSISGYTPSILDIFSIIAILCGIIVIISKNPIISILYLIGLFAAISCYLISIGLTFIGLSYLIVYIGAVSILFLFILMLINIRTSELQSNTSNSLILSFIIIISFNYILFLILPYNMVIKNNYPDFIEYSLYTLNLKNSLSLNNESISFVTSKIWDGNLSEYSHITTLGNIMYTNYNIWLIIASLILLLAMIGTITITINKNN